MASGKGPIATEAPLTTPAVGQSSAIPAVVAPEPFAAEPIRAKSLKRGRESTPTSPPGTAAAAAAAVSELSPSKIARLVGFASRQSPAPLTGAAALEDERRQREEEERLHPPGAVSENPSQRVLADLLSGSPNLMSRPQDAPATSARAAAEGAVKALQAVAIPSVNDATSIVSPQSATSPVSAGSAAAGVPVSHSPLPMEVEPRNDRVHAAQPEAQMGEKAATSLSYPGVLPPGATMPAPAAPQRRVSLPLTSPPTNELGSRSPSSKKHKCPYCETEFTRHHNLKSHLLTHSQEKPYVCQQCQLRFRRLHDLKRHSKLHTGEKPHICPKCERKFARGDALARHAKGAGGCAGRRASMGSFAGDDDYEGADTTDADDSAMTGVIYDGAAGDQSMTEEDRRRLSLPSIKAQHVAAQAAAEYAAHSQTYPPAGQRPGGAGGALLPPTLDRGSMTSNAPTSAASGHTPSTSISSVPLSAGGSSSLYSQSGMTESPKPLSPGGQAAQEAQKRSLSGAHAPPFAHRQATTGLSLPGQAVTAAQRAGGPNHARTGSGADNANNMFATEEGIWAYTQSLDEKVKQLTDKILSLEGQITTLERTKTAQELQITHLTDEVMGLRQQLEARPDVSAASRS